MHEVYMCILVVVYMHVHFMRTHECMRHAYAWLVVCTHDMYAHHSHNPKNHFFKTKFGAQMQAKNNLHTISRFLKVL